MKKLILTGFIGLLGISLSAQPGPVEKSPQEMATQMTERMTENLALTEDQAARVYDMNLDFVTQMKESDSSRQEIFEAHRENLSTVLTEEQMEKLDRQMQKRRAMRRHKAQSREAAPEGVQPE